MVFEYISNHIDNANWIVISSLGINFPFGHGQNNVVSSPNKNKLFYWYYKL